MKPELLPLNVRQENEYEYAVFSWDSYQKTIARMAVFGKECMNNWFPNGLPKRPERKDFGLSEEKYVLIEPVFES